MFSLYHCPWRSTVRLNARSRLSVPLDRDYITLTHIVWVWTGLNGTRSMEHCSLSQTTPSPRHQNDTFQISS